MGFKACILSNNGEKRIVRWPNSWTFHIFIELPSLIPLVFKGDAFNGLAEGRNGGNRDQLFTDILGGNRAGLFTILVVPLDRREFFGTKISRMMEKLVMHKIRRQQAKK